MLLQAGREALHRDLLRRRQHQRRARRDLADLGRPEATIATPSMLGPARLDRDVELLLLEVAELLGGDLADLVVAGEPAELKVDGLRLRLGEAARRQELRRRSRWRREPVVRASGGESLA